LRVRLCRQHEQEILGGQRRHGHHRLRALRPDVDHHPDQQRQALLHLFGIGGVHPQPARVARRIGVHQHRLRRRQQALHVVARQRAHQFNIHRHRIQVDAMRGAVFLHQGRGHAVTWSTKGMKVDQPGQALAPRTWRRQPAASVST
jgi:hypothetical protein